MKSDPEDEFKVLVFRSAKDPGDLGLDDDFFGFTTKIKSEVIKVLATFKTNVQKADKKAGEVMV